MKKLISLLISLSVILTCMSGISLVASADVTIGSVTLAGSGTDADPYIIDSAEKFVAVFGNGSTADLTKVYLLTGFDSTAMELPTTYIPSSTAFSGTLRGGNKAADGTITDVVQKINLGTVSVSGNGVAATSNNNVRGVLFQILNGANVENLELSGTITATNLWYYFGVVSGYIKNTTLNNIINRADVDSKMGRATGGIVGWSDGTAYSNITNCVNYGNIVLSDNSNNNVGGIVGNATYVNFDKCYNYGNITGGTSTTIYTANVGGIAGYTGATTPIVNCANFGDISAKSTYAGGISGNTNGGTINESYNMGNISNTANGGSISGRVYTNNATISNCFNTGVIDATNKGIIAGANAKTLTILNFYDISNPDITSVVGSNTGTLTVTNVYGYNKNESTTANDISKVSYETIAALTDTVDAFKDTNVWTKQTGYPFPSLENNLLTIDGTAEKPYLIFVLDDLKKVSNYPTAHYKLMSDITGMNEMLCTETAFSGVFDGNGKSITLAIDESSYKGTDTNRKYVGLFSKVAGTIKNLTTKGTVNVGYVGWQEGAGAIVGLGETSAFLLENCKNYADVTSVAGHQVAGLVGRAHNGKITKCYNYADVTAYKASGIVGVASSASNTAYITDCGNYGDITADYIASGICSWTYVWNWINNCFNVGTITARDTEKGIACGLFAEMTNGTVNKVLRGHNIQYSFNAGSLIANTTYGIAQFKDSNSVNSNVRYCYNAVAADYPITNNVFLADATSYPSYYLADASSIDDENPNTTIISKEDLKNLEVKTYGTVRLKTDSNSAYKYPQIPGNPLDEGYADIDFSLVTVNKTLENETEVKVLASDDAKFYTVTGTDVKLTVNVSDLDFYKAYVNGEIADGEVSVSVNNDTTITITDEKITADKPEKIETVNYIFEGTEPVTVNEVEYNEYALVASKAVKVPGLKLKGFGILFGLTADSCDKEFAGEDGKIADDGSFGILIYNETEGKGLEEGTTYYFKPYAKYIDIDGNEHIVCGDADDFSYNIIK